MISPDVNMQPSSLESNEISNGSDRSENPLNRNSPLELRRHSEIFDSYHQIGSELKYSLKAFENSNLHLSTVLRKLQQDVALLEQKRELHKSTLVELQVKAEKLDQTKLSLVSECNRDKNEKLQQLIEECNSVCGDENYLKETLEKISNLLASDKKDIDYFSNKVQQEHASQIRSISEYKQNTESAFKCCYEMVKGSIEEEKNVDWELEEALEQCKNKSGLKEKYENVLQEKLINLQQIEREVSDLFLRCQTCKLELDTTMSDNKSMNDTSSTKAYHSYTLTEKQRVYEEMRKQVDDTRLVLVESEPRIKTAFQVNECLEKQIDSVVSQTSKTSREIQELDEQISEINKKLSDGQMQMKGLEEKLFESSSIRELERQISLRKTIILEQLSRNNSNVVELEKKLGETRETWSRAKSKAEELIKVEEEMKIRNASMQEELRELLEGLGDLENDTKLRNLEQEISRLEKKCEILREQNSDAEKRLEIFALEMARLETENSLLDQDLQEAAVREEETVKKYGSFPNEMARLNQRKSKLSNVKENLASIQSRKDFEINIEQMKEDLRKIQEEIHCKKQQHETQKDAIQEPFKKTLQNLNEQTKKLGEALKEEMERKQSQIAKIQNSMVRLQEELQTRRADLIQTTEKNISMMRERLKITHQLVENYNDLQTSSQKANGNQFAVLRKLGTIEEHLGPSIRAMREYFRMKPIHLSSPSYSDYKQTLDNYESLFNKKTLEGNQKLSDPTFLAEIEAIALCLFGLCGYVDVPSESSIFSPSSSSIMNFDLFKLHRTQT